MERRTQTLTAIRTGRGTGNFSHARYRPIPIPARVRGVVLVIALIGLVAMSIAAAFLVRSTSTANQVAGNIAMRQSVERVAAIAFEMAVDSVANGAVSAAGLENGWRATGINGSHKVTGEKCTPGNADNNCWYFPRELYARDARAGAGNTAIPSACRGGDISWDENKAVVPAGIPVCIPVQNIGGTSTPAAMIDWFSDSKFEALTSSNDERIPKGYSIRYIVDRQCAVASANSIAWNPNGGNTDSVVPPKNPSAVRKFCRTVETMPPSVGGKEWDTQKAGESKYSAVINDDETEVTVPQTYFRISVQIIGPRATVHFAQALVLI